MRHKDEGWRPVVEAADCEPCDFCGELVCPVCLERAAAAGEPLDHDMPMHFHDCACPGPHQDDEFEYRTRPDGKLEARPLEA